MLDPYGLLGDFTQAYTGHSLPHRETAQITGKGKGSRLLYDPLVGSGMSFAFAEVLTCSQQSSASGS